MKKIKFQVFLLSVMLFSLCLNTRAADIYVSKTKGSDYYTGTREKPFATVAMALRSARELRRLNNPSIKNGIFIRISGGVYQLNEALVFRPEDSGTKESPTQIVCLNQEEVVLSGGRNLSGWKRADAIIGLPKEARGKVWVADVYGSGGKASQFRQLWVNGQKALRARDVIPGQMNRILSWNSKDQTCRIPLPKGISLQRIKGMEMLIHQWWAVANLRIKAVKVTKEFAELSFLQPESRIQSEHPWPAPWLSAKTGNSAFYLTNAIQFLDQPGEWYEDVNKGKLYYWPKSTIDLKKASVVVPFLETLVKIEGTVDRPVSYVSFKGISFQHAGWLRPSEQGHVPHQAGMYMLDAYKLKVPGTPDKKGLENQAWVGRPSAAVEISYAHHTGFDSCRFEHHASSGLDYKIGTHDDQVAGNVFRDIGGSAILVGQFSNEATEVHLPYNPSDEREICTDESLVNNLITDVTNEDWGCAGIGAGYVRGIKILHNEISEVSYSGISMGWGWTKTTNAMKNNTIAGNKIYHYAKHMYDVAGIYTLSAQPGSLISDNYVDNIYKAPYVHDPDHWFYLYTDEGSSFITIKNNWTPSTKYLQNANGPGNVWENNGPQVDESIKQTAGLSKEYAYLNRFKTLVHGHQEINTDKFVPKKTVVLELVFKEASKANLDSLKSFCLKNNIPGDYIQQWNNRLIIYGTLKDAEGEQRMLRQAFPKAEIRAYENAFYNFNRQTNCGDLPVKEWDQVILTANLVDNKKLQQEYLDYHATQFKNWPEVAQGFCSADFQQLLVFKNGRQLMLVISIPKGAKLEDLNPRTTKNNPRVDQWNALMKKYQESIPGAKQGEVWVFFKKPD